MTRPTTLLMSELGGISSAVGLAEHERALWPLLRERLRVPGADVHPARIGDDEEDVLVARINGEGHPRPVAVFVTDWMREHLYLYARKLWHRRH